MLEAQMYIHPRCLRLNPLAVGVNTTKRQHVQNLEASQSNFNHVLNLLLVLIF